MKLLTVRATVKVPLHEVWNYWTNPNHIMHWNFASADWHCLNATNKLEVGGEFHYEMAEK